MSPTTTQKLMTADELFELPSGRQRYELVRGELITMAPAGFDHGAVGMRIGYLIYSHVAKRKLGFVLNADTGFILSRNPDTVRAPDVSFVARDRAEAAGFPTKFFPGAPDLAVEVLSPSDTVEASEEKTAEYLDAGCSMVWIVNPRRKTVTIHRPKSQPRVSRDQEILSGEDVIAGFECAVSEIFE